jgi:hypothetical protein
LPIGVHVADLGKFSSTWEGPFLIKRILGKGAYQLMDKDGDVHQHPIHGQWLKKYQPSLWEEREIDLDKE